MILLIYNLDITKVRGVFMDFMIGCNYWDSKHGTDMWRYFDADVIRDDVSSLAKNGVKYMRVFPIWRDFQPVEMHRGWRGRG